MPLNVIVPVVTLSKSPLIAWIPPPLVISILTLLPTLNRPEFRIKEGFAAAIVVVPVLVIVTIFVGVVPVLAIDKVFTWIGRPVPVAWLAVPV